MHILNISKTRAGTFQWLEGRLPEDVSVRWSHIHCGPRNPIERCIRKPNLALHRGCREAARLTAKGGVDLLVSHLPIVTKWTEFHRSKTGSRPPHIAFSFNLDPMPGDLFIGSWRRLLSRIDRFVVYSSAERHRYAERFRLPIERIEMLHWGVTPPRIDQTAPRLVEGEYLAAIGRTGRNYRDFFAAMKRLPDQRGVVVASPACLKGLEVPANVTVMCDIPFDKMLNVLYHCQAMVLPLHDRDIPYGHGTAVLAMHLQRPMVVTAGEAMSDYIQDETTALTYQAGDVDGLIDQIQRLQEDASLSDRIAGDAYRFAREHCTEDALLKRVVPLLQETARNQ